MPTGSVYESKFSQRQLIPCIYATFDILVNAHFSNAFQLSTKFSSMPTCLVHFCW